MARKRNGKEKSKHKRMEECRVFRHSNVCVAQRRRQRQRRSHWIHIYRETDKYIKSELEIVIAGWCAIVHCVCTAYHHVHTVSHLRGISSSSSNIFDAKPNAQYSVFGTLDSKTFPFIYLFFSSFAFHSHFFLCCRWIAVWRFSLGSKQTDTFIVCRSFVREKKKNTNLC